MWLSTLNKNRSKKMSWHLWGSRELQDCKRGDICSRRASCTFRKVLATMAAQLVSHRSEVSDPFALQMGICRGRTFPFCSSSSSSQVAWISSVSSRSTQTPLSLLSVCSCICKCRGFQLSIGKLFFLSFNKNPKTGLTLRLKKIGKF